MYKQNKLQITLLIITLLTLTIIQFTDYGWNKKLDTQQDEIEKLRANIIIKRYVKYSPISSIIDFILNSYTK